MTHIIVINPSCEPKMLSDTMLYSKERKDLGDINAIEHLSLRALKANGFEYEFVEVAETGTVSHKAADLIPQTPAEPEESSIQPQAETKTADEPQPQVADIAKETKADVKDTAQSVKAAAKVEKKTETKTKKENSSSSKK